jgi:putative glutamine amidotransferase
MTTIAIPFCSRLHDYEEAVRRAGADPRVVPLSGVAAADVIRDADGLLLPGGDDVDPALYGERPHGTFEPAEPGRDALEIDLVHRALAADLPLLAICRGIQVLNVARGGTLVQDIAAHVPGAGAHVVRDSPVTIAHDVWVTRGTMLERLLRERLEDDTCPVNSRHHQAARRVGDGLVVAATAPDGVVEALEDPAKRFCLGVQWHPENFYRTGEFRGLFEGFVRAAQQSRRA